MNDLNELQLILEHRKQQWIQHCLFVLDKILLPICNEGHKKKHTSYSRALILIENRIDKQWLFTILNSWLMCPPGTKVILITDKQNLGSAESTLKQYAPTIEAQFYCVEEITPGTNLKSPVSFNEMMKNPNFWKSLPFEQNLIVQTDALLAKPLNTYFFQFSYIGAPFLPRQQTEYFEKRDQKGNIREFFKIETPIHPSPHPEIFPHLNGNGGLSIRHRSIMEKVSQIWGCESPITEAEDVFFSRHTPKLVTPPPLEVAQIFATETTYNSVAVGSHACWKYLNSCDIAEHLIQHLRNASAMANALRQQN